MRPYDPRLARYAHATRGYLAATVAIGLCTVALVIVQARLLAGAIAGVIGAGRDLASLRGTLIALAVVVAGRAGLAYAQEVAAYRASAAVKAQLRERLLRRVLGLDGHHEPYQGRAGELATVATRGLDALDAYFARYLPQLVLAAAVPAVVVAWILPADIIAGLTIAFTLPLIPIFMALVGLSTQRLNSRQFAALSRLGHHMLELIAGLPTLKLLGRARAQARAIRELTDEQRRLTMRTLRLAFLLSSLVLELLSTMCVALVAVGVGLRVVGGSLDLRTALFVLILAPEAYLPLRALGAQYHASAEGLAAARRVLDVLETQDSQPVRPAVQASDTAVASMARGPIFIDDVSVVYPDRAGPALPAVRLRIEPGEMLAIVGPSGCGKTTLASVLVRNVSPTSGRVLLAGADHRDLADIDPDVWRRHVAYVPQQPYLFAGTVGDNIDLRGDASTAARDRAAAEASLDDLPDGLSTVVGEAGAGLSAGQRQRVALARAFLHGGELVVLDEPTANLDPSTEAQVIAAIRRLARGRTVVVIAHHPALIAEADRVIDLADADVLAMHDPRAGLEIMREAAVQEPAVA